MMLKKLKHILKTKHSHPSSPRKRGFRLQPWILAFARMTGLLILSSTLLCACNKPSGDFIDSTGTAVNLKNYQGKWLVINYWADWCLPCLQELPALNTFYKKHKKNLVVLGVNFDRLPNKKIKAFQKQYALNFPMTNQFPIEKYGVKNVPNLPMTFIIAPNGKLKSTLIGPQNENSLENELTLEG